MMHSGKSFAEKILWWHWIILALTLLLVACSKEPDSVEKTSDPTIVAEVNGEKITAENLRRELNSLIRQFRVKDKSSLTPEEWIVLKNKGLNRIIQNLLLEKEMTANKIQLSPEEYEEALHLAKNGYQEDSFSKFLEVEGISPEEWERKFKINMLIKKLINTKVNSKVSLKEGEVQRYYENHQEEFQKAEQVQALHIMVETEDEARDIHKRLKSGKKDFSNLAQEYSRGPEGPEGGDLGYFEAGQMPEEFDGVFKLKIKQISEVIQTPYGYHIFKVVDKKPARKMSFEESREIIENQLLRRAQDKAFEDWFVKLKDQSDINIDYDALAKIN
ncbi:hypothetical protein UR09_01150 [Candidatus Nitromaritima sp. SCGC AAA799-A02]|nr:hypothetical protein UR09_01150 [Candidatus Nitromaritima sp. SCGC AAA799-A02]